MTRRIGSNNVFGIFLVMLTLSMFVIGGCVSNTNTNNGGGGGGLINQAVLALVVTPSTVSYGSTASLSTTGGSGTGAVTFSVNNSTGCSVTGTTLAVTNASGTCSAAATKAGDTTYNPTTSAAVAVTLVKATPTITWSVSGSISSATTLASVLTASANAAGAFAYTATPSGGTASTVTGSSTLAAGSYTLTANFTPTDANNYNAAATTVSLTVTQAPPTITSVVPATWYTDLPALLGGWQINGTGFLSGDTLTVVGCPLAGATYVNSTTVTFSLNCIGKGYAVGYSSAKICRSGGTPCSNVSVFAYWGPIYKSMGISGGELYVQLGATVYKYKVDGGALTADGSFSPGGYPVNLSVDNTTGLILLGAEVVDNNGAIKSTPAADAYTLWGDTGMENGLVCGTRPIQGQMTCFSATGGIGTPTSSQPVGSQPISIAMANFGDTTTRWEYVVSRGGTTTLWLLKNEVMTSSVQLTGATSVSSYPASTSLGGFPIVVFETGPAKGRVVVLDVADALLFISNQGATSVQSVKLAGTPVNIIKNEVDGTVIIAYANLPSGTTTLSAVNVVSGTSSTRTSTSNQFPVGGIVSPDGTTIWFSQTTLDAESNQ